MQTLADKSDIVELKKFALTMVWAFPVFFILLIPWIFSYDMHWWPLVVSAVLALFYLVRPRLIYYPYRVWMNIALVLGWINTRIILGLVFFTLIFPLGFLLRTLNKLQYQNHPPKTLESYYIARNEKLAAKQLERPF